MVYAPGTRAMAERIADEFSRRRALAGTWLGIRNHRPVTIHVVADYDGMVQQAPGAPEWATAVCRRDDVMVFRFDRVDRSLNDRLLLVLSHEVTHQLLTHLGGLPLPRWFEEGLCVHHAGVAYLELDTTLPRLGAARRLPTMEQANGYFLSDGRRAAIAYRFGHAAVQRMEREYGLEAIRHLLTRVSEGVPFESAFYDATSVNLGEFERDLHRELTPFLPYFLYIIASDLGSSLFAFGGLLVFFAYLRQRFRRKRELDAMDRAAAGYDSVNS